MNTTKAVSGTNTDNCKQGSEEQKNKFLECITEAGSKAVASAKSIIKKYSRDSRDCSKSISASSIGNNCRVPSTESDVTFDIVMNLTKFAIICAQVANLFYEAKEYDEKSVEKIIKDVSADLYGIIRDLENFVTNQRSFATSGVGRNNYVRIIEYAADIADFVIKEYMTSKARHAIHIARICIYNTSMAYLYSKINLSFTNSSHRKNMIKKFIETAKQASLAINYLKETKKKQECSNEAVQLKTNNVSIRLWYEGLKRMNNIKSTKYKQVQSHFIENGIEVSSERVEDNVGLIINTAAFKALKSSFLSGNAVQVQDSINSIFSRMILQDCYRGDRLNYTEAAGNFYTYRGAATQELQEFFIASNFYVLYKIGLNYKSNKNDTESKENPINLTINVAHCDTPWCIYFETMAKIHRKMNYRLNIHINCNTESKESSTKSAWQQLNDHLRNFKELIEKYSERAVKKYAGSTDIEKEREYDWTWVSDTIAQPVPRTGKSSEVYKKKFL